MDELWKIKEQLAEENGYDMDKLAALVKEQERSATEEVVNLSASRKTD